MLLERKAFGLFLLTVVVVVCEVNPGVFYIVSYGNEEWDALLTPSSSGVTPVADQYRSLGLSQGRLLGPRCSLKTSFERSLSEFRALSYAVGYSMSC